MRIRVLAAAALAAVLSLSGFVGPQEDVAGPSVPPASTTTLSAGQAESSPEQREQVEPAPASTEQPPASESAAEPAASTATPAPDTADAADQATPSQPESIASTEAAAADTPEAEQSAADPAEQDAQSARMMPFALGDAPNILIDGPEVDLVVARTATGTGHGTTAQCGINSGNPDLFPDSNLADAPADDSPYDEYVCMRDTIEYQLQLNFGQEALPTARTVSFDFSIVDQGINPRSLRFHTDVSRLCSAAIPGVYSGTTQILDSERTSVVRCTLQVEAGVSGSVLLPPIIIDPYPNRASGSYLKPVVTFGGQAVPAPPVTLLSMPSTDFVNRLSATSANVGPRPNPMLMILDGVPGLVMM